MDLEKHQHGFRKGFSTIHHLVHFFNHVAEAINKKQFTLAIFVDLTKAFDTVNHEVLFKNLSVMALEVLH